MLYLNKFQQNSYNYCNGSDNMILQVDMNIAMYLAKLILLLQTLYKDLEYSIDIYPGI